MSFTHLKITHRLLCILILTLASSAAAKDTNRSGFFLQSKVGYQYIANKDKNGTDFGADLATGFALSERWDLEFGHIPLTSKIKNNTDIQKDSGDLIYSSINYKYSPNQKFKFLARTGLNYWEGEHDKLQCTPLCATEHHTGGLFAFGFNYSFNPYLAMVVDYSIHSNDIFVADIFSIGLRFGSN